MCNVCCAIQALEAPTTFWWRNNGVEHGLTVEARGSGPESQPAQYRFRRVGRDRRGISYDDNEPWSLWMETQDLAGVMGRLGVDRDWRYGDPTVQAYLLGFERTAPVEAMLAAAEVRGGA